MGPLSEIFTIVNLRHSASRIWTCAEPDFRISWMKMCSSDNHCIKWIGWIFNRPLYFAKTLIQEFVKIVWINHINGPYQRKRICDFKINAKFQPLSNKPIYGAISRTLRWHHSCISLAAIRDQYIECQVFQKYQGFP